MDVTDFCNLISEVISITLAFAKSKSLGTVYTQGDGITQGHGCREMNTIGGHVKSYLPVVLGAISKILICIIFRQMILTGCVAFARHVGPTRVEAELLPQCWEQVNHYWGFL